VEKVSVSRPSALVTGGCGFIGSHVVDRLVGMGLQVMVMDDLSSESNSKFYHNDKANFFKIDISDAEKVSDFFESNKVDWVFHLAAESRIQPAIENPLYAVRVNVQGTCNLLQAARLNGVSRFMYSSTSAAYGLANDPPLSEDMKRDCLNPYSASKCVGEDFCKIYNSLYGLNTVCFRYFNVYGERQPTRGQYAPVIGLFQRQVENGEPMTIVGDGLQKRDFTYVGDVAEANILAAKSDNEKIFGEVFNVGSGKNYSVLDIAEMIGDNWTHIPPRPGEARVSLADNSKIKNALGWEPTVDISEWVRLGSIL
jgi:UDP-glucose 4-epimerase